jgi:S1-C subfamily serine protease
MIGGMPVTIHSVDPNSPSDRAGLKQNDVILTLNGVNVQNKCHRDLFRIIKNCNSNPKIEVIQKNEYVRTEPKSDSTNSFKKCELKNNENKTFREKVFCFFLF